jgi:hypothetical protein
MLDADGHVVTNGLCFILFLQQHYISRVKKIPTVGSEGKDLLDCCHKVLLDNVPSTPVKGPYLTIWI